MTSLTEVYEGNAREVTSLRRLYAGTALVLLGASFSVVAVLLATTGLFSEFVTSAAQSWGMGEDYASVRIAGVLAGLGVPAALVGVFIVLPAGRWVRAAGAISASLCLCGVTLFWYAYPAHWRGYGDELTLQVSVVYLLGLFVAIWCLFTAIVNFKTRNDPGGMLEMNVTRHNQTIVEVDDDGDDSGSFGGIGLLGGTPAGDVETQTNANAEEDDETTLSFDEREATSGGTTPSEPARAAGTATSDGGTAATDISSPIESGDGRDAEIVDSTTTAESTESPADRYCGNCRHFEYVRSSSGMVPYCARHDRAMDDMDACEEWTPNRQ
ncbi:DUF7139 domain-containing protein [Halopiger djelfimassiliensis]|uniref:DUF7139 domain-containing protein n=1 Tax=Halopiger djelfimassiliensis TaxID=1293047 RepID=UPI000677A2DB|nr:Yip1 family protein [Halopiger djelfimassiliensis]